MVFLWEPLAVTFEGCPASARGGHTNAEQVLNKTDAAR